MDTQQHVAMNSNNTMALRKQEGIQVKRKSETREKMNEHQLWKGIL
jgi:hypothetical protein